MMRTGQFALATFAFLFGIAFTARCEAMPFCNTATSLCSDSPSQFERHGYK